VYRSLQFHERSQHFIGVHNEPPSVVAVCVSNPDCPPLTINGRNTAPTPSGFAQIVGDDFPIFQASRRISRRRRCSRFAIMVAKFLRIPDGAAVYVIWAAWIAVVVIIGMIVMLWR
jgi:hypothetical protein